MTIHDAQDVNFLSFNIKDFTILERLDLNCLPLAMCNLQQRGGL